MKFVFFQKIRILSHFAIASLVLKWQNDGGHNLMEHLDFFKFVAGQRKLLGKL
jgi:hypothetical protein